MIDWQKGDLALCVIDGINTAAGQCFTVVAVHPQKVCLAYNSVPERMATILGFAEVRHPHNPFGLYADSRFIKITPPLADAFDHEVINLMVGKEVEA